MAPSLRGLAFCTTKVTFDIVFITTGFADTEALYDELGIGCVAARVMSVGTTTVSIGMPAWSVVSNVKPVTGI